MQDRAALWNAASAAEKRKDAREAQEIIVNLPHELSDQQRRFMLTDFVREHITRGTGRIADVNIHAAPKHGDDRNIHAHILMTVREIGPDGFGKKLPDVTPQQIRHWKEKWAERGAKELRKAGFEIEADRWAVGYMDLAEAARGSFRARRPGLCGNAQPGSHETSRPARRQHGAEGHRNRPGQRRAGKGHRQSGNGQAEKRTCRDREADCSRRARKRRSPFTVTRQQGDEARRDQRSRRHAAKARSLERASLGQ